MTLDYTALLLENLPPYYHEDPTTNQVLYAFGSELARLEAAQHEVESGRWPQTATDTYGFLALWEELLRLPVRPEYLSVKQRQERCVARWRARNGGTGQDWVTAVTEAIGTSAWEYEEDNPASYTVTIWVPWAVGSTQFEAVEPAVRPLTPAHLDIVVDNKDHFIVDVSKVDEDTI